MESTGKKAPSIRYLITIAACCGLAASSIGIFTNSVGVFYSPVSADLGVGRGAFALHATLTALATGFLSPLAARLLDKLPLRLLLGAGTALSCGATALMAFADQVWQFYVLGVAKGIGMVCFSLMFVTAVLSNWFRKHHGLVVGVVLSFSGLSGAVFSPIFSSCIASLGWRQAYLLMALSGLILTLPGIFTLRFTPAECSLPPYGGTFEPAVDNIRLEKPAFKPYLPALAILGCLTVLQTAVTGIAQHFPGLSESAGMGAQVGAAMVSASMVGNIVSKLLIGALSDRIGPFKASSVMILVNVGSLLLLLFIPQDLPVLALAAAFFYGAVFSISAVGIPVLTRRLFGAEQYARTYSLMTLFTSIGSASSLTIIGLVYDFTGGYQAALIGGVLIGCCSLLLLSVLSRMKTTT